jgi:hypothetical protein
LAVHDSTRREQMAVTIDNDRPLRGIAASLYQKVLPGIAPGSARFTANAAAEMAVHALHRGTSSVLLPGVGAATKMANEIRALTSKPVNAETAHHLLALLQSDSKAYRDDFDAYRTLMKSIAGPAARRCGSFRVSSSRH